MLGSILPPTTILLVTPGAAQFYLTVYRKWINLACLAVDNYSLWNKYYWLIGFSEIKIYFFFVFLTNQKTKKEKKSPRFNFISAYLLFIFKKVST